MAAVTGARARYGRACPQTQERAGFTDPVSAQGLQQRLAQSAEEAAKRDTGHQAELAGEAVRRKELQTQVRLCLVPNPGSRHPCRAALPDAASQAATTRPRSPSPETATVPELLGGRPQDVLEAVG